VTLVELLAAIAIFTVISGLAMQLYIRTRRTMRAQTARAVSTSQQLDLLAMIERDARMATRSVYRLGPFRQDLHTLTLEMPARGRTAGREARQSRYVVYQAGGKGPYNLTRRTYASGSRKAATEEVVAEGLREVVFGCQGRLVTVKWAALRLRSGQALAPGERPIETPMQTAVCMRNFR